MKTGINLPQDSPIALLDSYPKNFESYYREVGSLMFTATVFFIARN